MGENKNDLEKMENMKQDYREIEMSEEQVEKMKHRMAEARKEKRMKANQKVMRNFVAAAAVAAVFVAVPNMSAKAAYAMSNIPVIGKLVEVVTFRDYKYESERQNADVKVPELVADTLATEQGTEENAANTEVQENLKKTTEEINAEIQEITEEIVAEFESGLAQEDGYQDIVVKSEVIATTENYFTLKLICFQAAGSGAEWDYFYTIDLTTGERLAMKDLFVEGADYVTPISEDIKTQMREQMDADDMVSYWLDDEEISEEWRFVAITEETSFYLNENDELVIAFNEGDVAPMYMGTVEFVIPNDVIAEIRK